MRAETPSGSQSSNASPVRTSLESVAELEYSHGFALLVDFDRYLLLF